MSDDRGWYPAYGSDDRGDEGRYRDEPDYDPYAQGQQPYDPYRRQPQQPQSPSGRRQAGQRQQQEPWTGNQYGRQQGGDARGSGGGNGRYDNGQYGDGQYDDGRGYGDQGRGQGRDAWSPGGRQPGRGADRAASGNAYPGRDRYGDGAWSPLDQQPQDAAGGQGRRGARDNAESDAWSPRSRGGDPRRAAVGSAAAAAGGVGVADPRAVNGRVNDDIDLDEVDPSGRARRSGARGGGPGGPGGKSRRRKIIKWTAIGISTTLVLILAAGAYVILHLTGNIKHTALLENGVTQSPEATDKYGRSPLNVLVIGSDTRDTAADCHIGGDCANGGAGANADVEMVVHLAADRSNATVMSIPRDTVVPLPHCTDPTTKVSGGGFSATINTSLQWGPACTVTAVHNLTGLTIDHFVMVDFSGVESLSNALGGVQVCVSAKMYDPYSKLRLNKGENMVEGASALAFVRSRHGFYDGSDLGREKAQHYFLSAMIREVRSNMNLSDLGTLYKVANAATRALTVDDGLSGITGLEGLATTMNRVPTDRISFVTMPWTIDPGNSAHVIASQPSAGQMFQNIQSDVSYSTAAKGAASSSASPSVAKSSAPARTVVTPTVSVNKAAVHVQVLNGTGVQGRAADIRTALASNGFSSGLISTGTADSAATTKV
jgi:LCP family protein required for cell wall assembly